MKKLSLLILSIVVVGVMFLVSTQTAKADAANASLAADQTYTGFFIRAADQVTIDGTVNGDVWAAGTDVRINGTVHGSVYAAGQRVTVNGNIDGNLQAAGSRVEVNGKVHGAMYAAGSEVVINSNASVGNGAILGGSLVEVNGPIHNQTIVAGTVVKINAPIDGNLTIQGSQGELSSNAKVNGNLKYNQEMKINIANDKAITGSVVKTDSGPKGPSLADRLRDILFGLLTSFVTGFVLFALLPKTSQSVSDHLGKHPFESFFAGVVFAIFVPVVALLLLFTFIGTQLAILLGLGYVAFLMIGQLFVALCIGNFITRPKKVTVLAIAASFGLGLIILNVLILVPYVGPVVSFVTIIIGAGALASRTARRIKELRGQQLHTK